MMLSWSPWPTLWKSDLFSYKKRLGVKCTFTSCYLIRGVVLASWPLTWKTCLEAGCVYTPWGTILHLHPKKAGWLETARCCMHIYCWRLRPLSSAHSPGSRGSYIRDLALLFGQKRFSKMGCFIYKVWNTRPSGSGWGVNSSSYRPETWPHYSRAWLGPPHWNTGGQGGLVHGLGLGLGSAIC